MTNIPIEKLNLNWRIVRKLKKNGIHLVNTLIEKSEGNLWNECRLSRIELAEINRQLSGIGLTLKLENDNASHLILEDG